MFGRMGMFKHRNLFNISLIPKHKLGLQDVTEHVWNANIHLTMLAGSKEGASSRLLSNRGLILGALEDVDSVEADPNDEVEPCVRRN